MTVRQQTCFIARCDECGTDYEHDWTPHWPTEGEALDDAVGSGEWWSDGTALLCDSCKLIPHNFAKSELFVDCARCDIAEEDHEVKA